MQLFNMKPYELFAKVFHKWIKSCSAILGYDILDENYKVSFVTINTIVGIISIPLFSVYTAMAYDFDVALKASSLFSLAWQVSYSARVIAIPQMKNKLKYITQGIAKSYVILARGSDIRNSVNTLERIYKQNEKSSKDYARTLETCSTNVFRITQALSILYFMCGATFISWPIISYVFFGKMEPSCPIFLPMINSETNIGFVVNWIYHIYILTLATFGFIFCDAMYADLVFHVHMMSSLIAKQWNFINVQMKEQNLTDLEVKLLFRNLCYMHQEMTT